MIIDPISAGVGVLSAGLGIFQGIAQSKAQKQQYVNDTAFSNATAQFNQWQAGLNYQTQNLNNQYGYWRDTVNHNQQLAYTNQLRNYEFSKELARVEVLKHLPRIVKLDGDMIKPSEREMATGSGGE